MEKRKIRTPFFSVNPKAYIYGDASVALAKFTDQMAEKYDIDVFYTGQHVDLARIKNETKHVIVTAQNMDGLVPGRGMGHILPEALKAAGVEAVFLNHAEHPLTVNQLAQAISRADELGILTIVCADTAEEAKAIAQLKPDVLDKFDADAAVDDLADALGVNPKTIVSGRDVAVIRQQRAEQQAQQQAMMAQAANAQTTKDMSQIDTQNLGEVMQQLQGYGGMNG